MNPREYFEIIAQPTLEEFFEEDTSIRRCFLACVALYHIVDYIFYADQKQRFKNLDQLRDQMIQSDWYFRNVYDVCLAVKHFKTKRGVSSADAYVGAGAAFSDGAYYSDGTSHSDAPDVVRITVDNSVIDMDICLRQASEHVRRTLDSLGY